MKRLIVVLALPWTGCASTGVTRGALMVSTALLVCDWGQTMYAAATTSGMPFENNPILGERPSQGAITAYFITAIVLNAVAWRLTPEKYRATPTGIVTGAQALNVVNNARRATGVCGVGDGEARVTAKTNVRYYDW